ncbi:adenosylcobinamide amidohydrolase [Candidatus Electrothrix sp.]|uniref:adenosylcobinamide amidohydrolase n=1 Tax=Candidatus Electrothrix sp. TaxID=2170559 RepID=UPI0040562E4D
MKKQYKTIQGITLFLMLVFSISGTAWGAGFPLIFTDSGGKEITVQAAPQRVVSLVPSVTEMLLRIGAGDAVKGITYHSVLPQETAGKVIMGGFFRPDLDRVAAVEPDMIFYADLHKDVPKRFAGKDTLLVQLLPSSLEQSFAHLALLGSIFGHEDKAAEIIAEEKAVLSLIARKTAQIPGEKRQRVMRLMGGDVLMAPGDDSFQNEYIRAAGGIAPEFGRTGNIIPVSLEEWRNFNPQVLYACGGDRTALSILDQPGWKEVDAVRNKRIFFFPCDLTCRAATHQGYFTAWLAARIYNEAFGKPENFVLPEQVVSRKPIPLEVPYLDKAEIVESDIKDFRNKTVLLHLSKPMQVVSTLEGQRKGISTVGNHYFPPPSWGLGHQQGLAALNRSTRKVLGLDGKSTAMLFTGADMDNLAVVKEAYRDMEVTALVTAGVMGNALRMAADEGGFYEPDSLDKERMNQKKPGTINILLLSNMQLSPRAMTRALISATEAKSAALQDMDIRSSRSRRSNRATGTGTDNIIVVEGEGTPIDATGGHTKMGELIARTVYAGVQEAVYKQNGLVTGRSVFQRLKERKVDLSTLSRYFAGKDGNARSLRTKVEQLLLDPKYAGFITALMAVADDAGKGLVQDTAGIDLWCRTIAAEIAGKPVALPAPYSTEQKEDPLPPVLAQGLTALFSGVAEQ